MWLGPSLLPACLPAAVYMPVCLTSRSGTTTVAEVGCLAAGTRCQSTLHRNAPTASVPGLSSRAPCTAGHPPHTRACPHPTPPLATLSQELSAPLSNYVKNFPNPSKLHPFEGALLQLTVSQVAYRCVQTGGSSQLSCW